MLDKLKAAGLSNGFLKFFKSYLFSREAVVSVNGQKSEVFNLANMVFQGTVLGPTLWNVYFKDVQPAAEACGGKESKFADDLNVTKTFPSNLPNNTIFEELKECQQSVHKWGTSNIVTFDELKEEFGLTYIFISHDLSVVKYMSDRMVVMQAGQIEEMGDADQIYNQPGTEYTKKLINAIPEGKLEDIKRHLESKGVKIS